MNCVEQYFVVHVFFLYSVWSANLKIRRFVPNEATRLHTEKRGGETV